MIAWPITGHINSVSDSDSALKGGQYTFLYLIHTIFIVDAAPALGKSMACTLPGARTSFRWAKAEKQLVGYLQKLLEGG